jgi:3-dehydro-L-gulonate 2-dehydrogenase
MIRIPLEEVESVLARIFARLGFDEVAAKTCARVFAEASRDGVASHGINRVPRFVSYVKSGVVDVRARAVRVSAPGSAWEQWDGRRAAGPLSAITCMSRAIELARINGVGAVGLRNTNHWMRGGAYGWQAADAGFLGICWTNTTPNLPPWGGRENRLGNNPIIVAVPRAEGAVVLDMSMSQFSYGRMETAQHRGERLPVAGGYDKAGQLTDDPGAILEAQRPLPIGFWKGAGLSLLLDLVAALISGGQTTSEIRREPAETGLSQVFIAFDLEKAMPAAARDALIASVLEWTASSAPAEGGAAGIKFPGERTLQARRDSLKNGVPVDEAIWKDVLALLTA